MGGVFIGCLMAKPAAALMFMETQGALARTPHASWTARPAVQPLAGGALPEADEVTFLSLPPITNGAAADGHDVAGSAACSDWTNRAVNGIASTQPTTGFIDIPGIKHGLLKGPLVSNVILFEDL
jgi:hypothetical protein